MSRTWNTVTPLSKKLALILFIALPFLGFWYGYSQRGTLPNSLTTVVSQNPTDSKPLCSSRGCWFDSVEGKVGFGNIKGYYQTYKVVDEFASGTKTSICDGFVLTDTNTQTAKNVNDAISKSDEFKGVLAVSVDLFNVSEPAKQKVLSSTKNRPVDLHIAQPGKPVRGSHGCFESSFYILDATMP